MLCYTQYLSFNSADLFKTVLDIPFDMYLICKQTYQKDQGCAWAQLTFPLSLDVFRSEVLTLAYYNKWRESNTIYWWSVSKLF